MKHPVTRREFIRTSTLVGTGFWLGSVSQGRAAQSPNEKLNLAVIGPGGRGKANLNSVAKENIVAICDVDDQRAGDAYERFPRAKKYYDFRRLFDEMEKQIDAVVISTPDHTHFHPAMWAMQRSKHVYLEKPMAHTVEEVRRLTELARQKKLATQLGVQRHTGSGMHRIVEIIQSGALGTVEEVHSWIGGDRGMPKVPTDMPPVPSHLKWDLWLGPAADRPYHSAYVPYSWRFWWDFGTGETGNWGCHILDIPYWALGLTYPLKVEASGPPVHPLTTPKSMTTRFEFPARGKQPAVTLHWYHAKEGPPILQKLGLPKSGNNLFIGSEGMMLCDFGKWKLYPEDKFADYKLPPKTIPDSPGFHNEWLLACKGGQPATCNFDYTGPMTETVLLGNVAYRAGGGFEWDAAQLKAIGNAEADRYLRTPYRKGWEI
ncbi:MAG: Gfo/Idh/MocA family protein [Gemmataceae bacterium]